MALRDLDPASTFVIVISKTFTTKETMLNAALVKRWLGDRYETHMCAVTADNEKARAFGCERVFGFGDYVGGRYSVWSPVGCLPLALQYGVRPVRELLRGARAMDTHFREAPLHENLPVVLALVGFLNAFIYERDCRAVLPYARALSLFPRYVQQLEMESNGQGRRRRRERAGGAGGRGGLRRGGDAGPALVLPAAAPGPCFPRLARFYPTALSPHRAPPRVPRRRRDGARAIAASARTRSPRRATSRAPSPREWRTPPPRPAQGLRVVPCEFLGVCAGDGENHDELFRNFCAQADALALGRRGRGQS